MRELDHMVVEAARDDAILEILIKKNEPFILKCAAAATNRYISKNDDEWSIALLSFTKAVQLYHMDKGSFLSFADLLMKRGLIDYHRSQNKYNSEISVSPDVFDTDLDENDENIALHIVVAEKISQKKDETLKEEILSANEMLSEYGFTFYDLVNCSPKAAKTKSACGKAVQYLLDNPLLMKEIQHSKQLPIKIIEKNCKVPRKLLERHRKYIIAAAEILAGEYPSLAHYMRFVREESLK